MSVSNPRTDHNHHFQSMSAPISTDDPPNSFCRNDWQVEFIFTKSISLNWWKKFCIMAAAHVKPAE
jgi:hypothetical protein